MAILTRSQSTLRRRVCILALLCVSLLSFVESAYAQRIKDIARIAGVRSNKLVGYGLIVGLNGSGDSVTSAPFTLQSFRSFLQELGVKVPPNVAIQSKNIAAVALSAELPAFAKPGQTIDVTVSSIGNAKSLRGGTLLMSPLMGADRRVYAIAQGNLVVSGFGGEGADGSKITVNIPSAGRIPNGATIERASPTPFADGNSITYNLLRADFTSAQHMVQTINHKVLPGIASAIDASSIKVKVPIDVAEKVAFLSKIENLTLRVGDAAAKVIINSRTGTIVIGNHVKVRPAAVAHGSLTVTISEAPFVSQPTPFSNGVTTSVESSSVSINQETKRAFLLKHTTTLQDIVNAINRVGAAPGDLVAILEALKAVGALEADLEVI